MPFEIVHFRESEKIIKEKRMEKDIKVTLGYIDDVLQGTIHRRELLNQALQEMDWRENGALNFLDGRRYQYKGFKRGIALEGSFSAYEYILEGLFRLQIGFDRGFVEAGILMLTSFRSEKSSLGTSKEIAQAEIEMLYPTISMPVSIALFDLGPPIISNGTEENNDGSISIPADDNGTVKESDQS
ncbi:hypothetical protein ACFL36_05540 [Thermodesulfobacteriota bacterium]